MEEKVTFQGEFDNQQIVDALEEMIKLFNSTSDSSEDFGKALENLGTEFGKLDKAQRKSVGSMAKAADAQDRATDGAFEFKKAIADQVREISFLGTSLGDVEKKLKLTKSGLLATSKGLGGASKALKLFKIALVSTGVGALVVALGSLVAFLTSTQRGLDKVNVVLDAVGSVVSNVVDRFAKLGEVITLLFSGEFQKASELAREAFQGIGEEITNDIQASVRLTKERQRIRDAEIALGVEYEKQRARIEELRSIGEDQTKSAAERSRAFQEAAAIEEDITNRRLKLAEDSLNVIREQNSLSESLTADKEKEAEAEIRLAEIRQESAGQQRELNNQLNALNQEQINRVNQLREAYTGFLDELDQRVQDAELAGLFGVDRLKKERELAIKEIELFQKSVIEAAQAAGQALPEGFKDQIAALFAEVERTYKAEVAKLTRTDISIVEPLKPTEQDVQDVQDLAARASSELAEGISKGIDNQKPILSRIKEDILASLRVSEEELGEISQSIGANFGRLLDSLDELTQAQISQQDRVIESLDEQISVTTSKLDQALADQAAGYRNDATALEEQLKRQQEAREAAEEERARLEQQAARRRIIQNNIEQASNLVLSITKLIAAESGKGLLGIVTALAGASLIYSLVAQSKAQSNQFGTTPAFREGTEFVEGPGDGRSDSINARLSRGERVLTADQNNLIGGRQISNDELVEFFNIGKAVSQFANAGVVSIPAQAMTEIVKDSKRTQSEIIKIKQELDMGTMKAAYEDAAKKSTDQLIQYFDSRPVTYFDETGAQVSKVKQGNTTVIRRAK